VHPHREGKGIHMDVYMYKESEDTYVCMYMESEDTYVCMYLQTQKNSVSCSCSVLQRMYL